MPQQDDDASELDEAEKVLGVILVARHEAPEVLQPRVQPRDAPAPPVATQGTAVLRGGAAAIGAVRGDEFDAPLSQPCIERIAVVGQVTD